MINLIPAEQKKKNKRDFYLRFMAVFFVMLAFAILIGAILLLPAYFISSIKLNSVILKLENQKKEPVKDFR